MKKITLIIVLAMISLTPFHSLKTSAVTAYTAYSQDFSNAVVDQLDSHFSTSKQTIRSINGNNMLVNDYDAAVPSPYWTAQLKGDPSSFLPAFSDFEFSFDVILLDKIDAKQPLFLIKARAGTNASDSLNFSYGMKGSVLSKGVNKIWIKDNPNTVMQLNKKYSMKIVAQGFNLKWYVDGNLIVEANDDAYYSGNFWFVTWACQVAIDNIVITTTDPKPTQYVPVSGVFIGKKSVEIEVGKVFYLPFGIQPSNATTKKVFWRSDDESVATVDGNGIVTAKKLGKAKVQVFSVDGGYGDYCDVTVVPLVLGSPSAAAPSSSAPPVQSKSAAVASISSESLVSSATSSASSTSSSSSAVSVSSVVSNKEKSGENNMSILPFIIAFAVIILLTAVGVVVYILLIKKRNINKD